MYLCKCNFIHAEKYKISIIEPPWTAFGPDKPALHRAPTSWPVALHRSALEGDGGEEPNGENTFPGKMNGKSRITCPCGSSLTKAMPHKGTFVSLYCLPLLTQCSAQTNLLYFSVMHKSWGSAVCFYLCV